MKFRRDAFPLGIAPPIRIEQRLEEVGKERPLLGDLPLLMDPALPHVYGEGESKNAPRRLKAHVEAVRATQPEEWPPGETPWPEAPQGGVIICTGDGR